MDAQMFLEEFAHIANAPGGIDQLRQMIYQLAVTGALTTRSEKGEDARALLEAVGIRRQGLIREKKYKRMVELEGEAIVEPFRIKLPSTWCWSRLLDVGEINPRNHADDDVKAAFLPMSGVPQLHRGGLVADTAKWGDIKKGYTHFASGDVVLAKITPCFENGKSAVIETLPAGCVIGGGTTELHVFRPIHAGVLSEYVYLFLKSPLFAAEGVKNMTGTAGQKRLPTDFFATRAFPLPPAEEQARIVAKVDELMALCDKLEAQQRVRQKLQNTLRQSAVAAVSSAGSSRDLQITWEFLSSVAANLISAGDDVDDFRKLVLELAIQGRLTEEFIRDESPRKLIERSKKARDALLTSGEMKGKKASSTDVRNLSIPIPSHWEMAALEDLFQFIDYRGKTPEKTIEGVVLVTAKNVRPGRLASDPVEYISQASYSDWMTRGFPRAGDLLITTEAPLGNVARIEIVPQFALAQRVIDLQPFSNIETKCTMYFMMSPTFQALLDVNATGMTAKGIKAGKLKQLFLPVPPRQEQVRIVARVESLLRICDSLSVQIDAMCQQANRFAIAAVSSLAGITTESREEAPMKAPQTELIAPLLLGKPPGMKAQAPLATILARHKGEMSAKDLWQRFSGEIDAFYAQLKIEIGHGWILEPGVAEMREKITEDTGA